MEEVIPEVSLCSSAEREEIERLEAWSLRTKEGSRNELTFPCHPESWERVSAEHDNCLNQACPHYKKCFFFSARQKAQEARILVVNHHLLCADLAARLEGKNFDRPCILPPYTRVIIDEAHRLEDISTEHFATRAGPRILLKLLQRLFLERGPCKIRSLVRKILECYPQGLPTQEIKNSVDLLELSLPFEKRGIIQETETFFEEVEQFLAKQPEEKWRIDPSQKDHPLKNEAVLYRLHLLNQNWKRWLLSLTSIEGTLYQDPLLKKGCEGIFSEIKGLCGKLEGQIDFITQFFQSSPPSDEVWWIESKKGQIEIVSAPLDPSKFLKASLFEKFPTVVLSSATLSTNRTFKFIKSRLGIAEAIEKVFDSPFNYTEGCLLGIPLDMPDPDSTGYVDAVVQRLASILSITKGGTFVLFTSYQMLAQCVKKITPFLAEEKLILLSQHEEKSEKLLEKFRETPRAVLFGTDSFWEGVDVAGDALRSVVIAKLPFKTPSDPLFQARSEEIEKEGKSAFFDYSLPQAVMKFKQGLAGSFGAPETMGA